MSTPNNARAVLTTAAADIYTAPAGGAKITMIQVANVAATADVDVTVQWLTSAAAVTRLCFNSTVANKDSLSVPAGGLILKAGEKIQALASATTSAEITVCALEG
jgi:hypothetical protein